jgi:MFS family permease
LGDRYAGDSGGGPRPVAPRKDVSSLARVVALARFRRFFAARTVSQWGDTFNAVAIVILVYRLTGSGLRVGGAVASEVLPVLVFGFVAGALVDRLPRKRVMVAADLERAVIAGLLAVFHSQLWMVYAAAFGLSSFSVFFNPAASSLVPTLVDEGDLVGANSAVWSAAVVSQIALAPAAGGLVGVTGAGPAFAINAGSFLVSAALLVGLPTATGPTASSAGWLPQIADGLRAIRVSRFLSTLAGVQALAALSAGATSALLVVLAQAHLHSAQGGSGSCWVPSGSAPV